MFGLLRDRRFETRPIKFNKTALVDRIATVERRPYPHFVVDDILPPKNLEAMLGHWPSAECFTPEVPQNYVCNLFSARLLPKPIRPFWENVRNTLAPELATAVSASFEPWISKRYGTTPIYFSNVSLMEADPTYPGHGCHTHHYHDPCWIGTALLYLDDDPANAGTTIHAPATGSPDVIAASTLLWKDMPEVKTVAYRQNRLFAIYDSPISYHSVKPASPGVKSRRRIFRIHLTVGAQHVKELYGVGIKEYASLRKQPSTDPTVLRWMQRDISQLS